MISVVSQVKRAFLRRNRFATVIGFLLGGFVPVAIFVVAHGEAFGALTSLAGSRPWALVSGGLIFSAQTVFQWARNAFASVAKSLGFVLLVEGVMVTSTTAWLSYAALAYLILINGIATGCTLSIGAPRKGAK